MHINILRKESRVYHISVHSLNHKKSYKSRQNLSKISIHKTNQSGHSVGDKRTNIRNQVPKTGQNTNDNSIANLQNTKTDADQHCHNCAVNNLSAKIACKYAICVYKETTELLQSSFSEK